MFFYDLDLNAWVRKPGSKSPPEMVPVVAIGGVFDFPTTLCRGSVTEAPTAQGWFAGLKLAGDFAGEYLAIDAAPEISGDDSVVFIFDLTSQIQYFTDNPTADTVGGAIQVSWNDAFGVERRTQPLAIVIQNDYLQTAPPT